MQIRVYTRGSMMRLIRPLVVMSTIAAMVGGGAGAPTKVLAAGPSQPTYIRTIGGQTEAIMYPSGDAVDAAGNVYIADTGNYRVEKYQAGTSNLLWSVGVRGAPIGPAGSGNDSFFAPRDIAVDATHVFVADTDNAIVQVLNSSDGSYVQSVTAFGAGQKFSDPIGISVGTDGHGGERILVSDGVSGNVYVFNTAFTLQLTIPPTSKTEGTRDAATDSAGNIYTADYRGNSVDVYDSTDSTGATPIRKWGSTVLSDCHNVNKPYGVDIDTTDTPNRIFVASSNLEQVKVFDPLGACLNVGATGSNAIGAAATTSSDPNAIFQLRRVAIGPGSNPLVYAADLWGLKILTYRSSDGTIATSSQPEIGDGTYPAAGNLNEPHGIAIDSTHGYVFATNTVNQRIERFNLDGTSPIDWGTKGVVESTASFNWAQGIAYDGANGNVWVANTRNNRIDEFSTSGTSIMSYPSSTRLTSIFNWPMAVVFDPAGNMYVADTFNNRVVAFSVSGSTVTQLWTQGTAGSGTGHFARPWDIAFDATQTPARILVADTNNSRIVSLVASSGAWSGTQPSIAKGSTPGSVLKPQGVATDAAGNIWVADTGNNRVEEFTSTGTFANQMIGSYGTSGSAFMNAPQGIEFDSVGHLYVADANNNRIQVFQPASAVPTFRSLVMNAGGVGPMYPAGGEMDAAGNMFIADSGGSRIDKIDPSLNITYIKPSTGTFSNPRNLSIDTTTPSDLWITDTGNNQIVEMDTSGNVLKRFNASSANPLTLASPFGNANDATNVYVADTYHHQIIAVAKSDGHTVWSTTTCSVTPTKPLARVRDVAVGSDGNLYGVDTDNNRVVEYSTAGACLAAWTGSATGTTLKLPRGLASDGAGGLWIAEDGNNPTLLHYNNAGTTLYGQTTNAGGFVEPEGVFTTTTGSVVIADPFAYKLTTFTVTSGVPSATGTALTYGTPALGGFNNPFGVAFAPNGDMFVSDMFNQRVEKFTVATSTWTTSGEFGGGSGNMQNPRGLSVSPDGLTLILTNSEDERIDLFNTSDLSFKQSIVPVCGKMNFPYQTAFDSVTGSYWIADTNNNRILQVDGTGNCLQNWTGGGLVSAPRGIAFDGTNVWVSNATLGQILRCTTTGTCSVVAAKTGTPVIVNKPWNLLVFGGNLWIADQGAGDVIVMTLAGNPVFNLGSPGSNPNLGQLTSPVSVGINPLNGQIAVADFGANLISIWQ